MQIAHYALPERPMTELAAEPQLESWDAKGTAAQLRLARWLDAVEVAASSLASPEADAAIALTVGVPASRPLITGGGDLDNYLHPVVRRLGQHRFASAWALKHHGPTTLSIAPAVPIPAPTGNGWQTCRIHATSSSQSSAFKAEVSDAIPLALLPDGPVEVQIAFVVSSKRNWASLWKPTIDALGNVLGRPHSHRPFWPNDDRIVRLGLHRTVDDSVGWAMGITVGWRAL